MYYNAILFPKIFRRYGFCNFRCVILTLQKKSIHQLTCCLRKERITICQICTR